jgi:hypothetical protein
MENFIKEYVSLILLLSTIFISAVGRILRNSQQCILLCSSRRDPNNFWPKWILQIISCITHTATISQHQKALAPQMGMLGTHSTFRIHLAADSGHWNWNERVSMSHSSLNEGDNIPQTAWEVYTYKLIQHGIITCEEAVSECLPFACTEPNFVQISAFLDSRDRNVSVWKVLIFKCLLLTFVENLISFFVYC